jgi:exopolysaccharide production protein ExoZ
MKQFVSIQVMRGIAAFAVLVFHAMGLGTPNDASGIHRFGLGGAGVDIFFVVSGFVMWTSTAASNPGAKAFWKARLIRIAPLYYLYTAIFVVMLYAHEQVVFRADEIIKSLLFIPFMNSHNLQSVPILGVGWTLNYEALFYLVFGCALLVRHNGWRFALVGAVLMGLISLRPMASYFDALAFRFTSPVMLEFLAGMAIAVQLPLLRRLPAPAGWMLLVAGTALLVGLWLIWPQLPRTIGFGIPATMIVAGALALEDRFCANAMAPLKILGDASYSMYLVHGLVFYCVEWFAPAWLKTAGFMAMWIALAVLVSWLSYRWVERPLLRDVFGRRG